MVVMVDANKNVREGRLRETIEQPDIDLTKISQRKHATLPYVPTFYQGEKGSAYQIDGIFVSPEIEICKVSWLPGGSIPG